MKRIPMVLVLLMTVMLVSTAGVVPKAHAGSDASVVDPAPGQKKVPVILSNSALPPTGSGTEGDPDSMGDGLSRDMTESNAAMDESSLSGDAGVPWIVQEQLLFLLAQIQLLLM